MFLSDIIRRRMVVGAVTGMLLCTTPGIAAADPPPRPPNCTAADVAGVAASVATALSEMAFGALEFGLGAAIGASDRWAQNVASAGAWFGEGGAAYQRHCLQ